MEFSIITAWCDKLSKYITCFRKCHGTQHSLLAWSYSMLLVMLEKWKKALDKGESVCTIFMDHKITRLLMVYLHQLWKKFLYCEKIRIT